MKNRKKFRPEQRLRKQDTFKALFEKGVFVRGRFFYLWAGTRQTAGAGGTEGRPALGVVVTRKTSPQATGRNVIKRRVREIFREHQHEMKTDAAVLIKAKEGRPAPGAREAEAEIMELLKKAGALR